MERVKVNREKTKRCLLYGYVVSFCFWALDVITTFFAIDWLGIAGEMNPLGWPWGAWGALAFYIPALVFTYLLLFRTQNKLSVWSAMIITALALGLGVMNLLAALHNIQLMLALL